MGVVPKSTLFTSVSGENTSTMPTTTSSTWVRKSATAKKMFTPADSFAPKMFTATRIATTDDPAHDVGGRLAQRLPEHAQVVGHEERRDRRR